MATANEAARKKAEPTRSVRHYDFDPHFEERVECDRRPITEARAVDAIENGTVEDNPVPRQYDEWRFRHRVDGLDVVVAAGESKHDGNLRVFTAFVDVADVATAWVSDTWSEDDVQVAAMLQCLNLGAGDAVAGFDPFRIHVHEPVPYHGHMVAWNEGFRTPWCLVCEHEAIDGDAFDRRPCY